MNIQQDLKKYLEVSGETPQQLAQKSGVHFTLIYRILSGNHDPRVSTLKKLWPFLYGDESTTQADNG